MAGRETKVRGVMAKVKGLVPVPREGPLKRENRTLRALDPGWVFPVAAGERRVRVVGVWVPADSAGEMLVWQFDAAVASVEGDAAPQLLASGDGVNFVAPDTVLTDTEGNGTVVAIYDGARFNPSGGVTFKLDSPPTTITFAQGRAVVPQTGLTIAPPAVPPASAGTLRTPAALRLTAPTRPTRKARRAA